MFCIGILNHPGGSVIQQQIHDFLFTRLSLPEPPSLDRRNGRLEEGGVAVDVWIHNPANFCPGALVIAGCHRSMVHQLQYLHDKQACEGHW